MSSYLNDLKGLKQAIDELEGNNFLIPEQVKFDSVLKECRDLLIKNEFVVKKVPKAVGIVKDIRGLVAQFYYILARLHPDVVPYTNQKVDLKIAKDLVNKIRELTSLEYTMAIGFASKLIDIVFKHEKEFNFESGSLYSFRVFGQGKMSWVTETAIRIYNRESHNEEELMRKADEATERYEKTHDIEFGYGSVEDIQDLIDKL